YRLVIIDSIQTVYDGRIDSAPGSITQVKEITNQLLRIAKSRGITIVLIGHVTKEGYLAGPRVMEHLVDTVLQFEGDSNYRYRILRAIKNRFGATNEVGLFEMQDKGMVEIANASGIFLEERPQDAAGSVIVPVIEGSRTILVEVQALISRAAFGNPQRLATGISKKRVSILLAVLEKKAGFDFQNLDAHLNIVGGLKIDEPALDLGLIVAMISSYRNQVISSGLAVVGEVGLAGEVRAVERIEERLSELRKLGFKKAIIPRYNMEKLDSYSNIEIQGVENIGGVIDLIFQ
ncbi:MAG: S16 family serine protease, partial [Halanaerobiales bacterium]